MPAAERREAVRVAVLEAGLGPEQLDAVDALLERPDVEWRVCCGGFCEPCTQALGRAVDRARALTGLRPPPASP